MSFAADTPLAVSLSPPAPPSGPVHFMDRGGLFGLLVKNAVLTFLTLGIYRFWARAALRRYWWGSVVIAGDALEYTGTGLELFIGFLIFLAIMLPFGVIYGLTGLLQASNPLAGAVLRLGELMIFFVLIQFVTFRARRYRLSRTMWRGVRASQGGTAGEYLWLVVKWTLVSMITLGIATPWARIETTEYLMDRTALGDLEARFHGRGSDLLAAWITPYLLSVGSLLLFFFLNIGTFGRATPGVIPHGLWLLAVAYIGGGLGFVAYLLIELRYTIRHTRLDTIAVGSSFKIGGIILRVIGLSLVALVVFGIVFFVFIGLITGIGVAHQAIPAGSLQLASFISTFASLIVGFALINILRIFWIDRAIVRQICETMSLSNVDRLDRIGQSTAPVPKAGEGMADAFDIGAF